MLTPPYVVVVVVVEDVTAGTTARGLIEALGSPGNEAVPGNP